MNVYQSFVNILCVRTFIYPSTVVSLAVSMVNMSVKKIISVRTFKFILAVLPLLILLSFNRKPTVLLPELQTIRTVVIDAGHGGKDPGCHGGSSLEKTVCLNMALHLGNFIKENYPSINVVFTRDKDVFIELDERAHIANQANADLFICIHANSASPSAYGVETYVLGLHKTDAQAKIADRENSTIYLEDDKGEKYKELEISPDLIIARQLQLSVFLDQSILFAGKLQGEFKGLGRYDRGVKQAGFLVLYKTTMPSVLIETGFLTNPEEERFLADTSNQRKMSRSMFNAFVKYKETLEGVDNQTNTTNRTVVNGTKPAQTVKVTAATLAPVVFKIQIETSPTSVPPKAARFKGLEVFEYKQDNLFKYTVGAFEGDFNAANNYKNELRENGFSNAFVVAFQNGERISLEKAIKLAKK